MPGVPAETPPTAWRLEAPPDDYRDDLWAVGADLAPGTLVAAYRLGLFPMPVGARIGWFSPETARCRAARAICALALLRRARQRYEIRVDTAFADVIRGCARPGDAASWIDPGVEAAYEQLHELRWAHSVEAWDTDGLAGGLYGVAIGGLFAAESMFHVRTDASKAAFVGLAELLRGAGAPTAACSTSSGSRPTSRG